LFFNGISVANTVPYWVWTQFIVYTIIVCATGNGLWFWAGRGLETFLLTSANLILITFGCLSFHRIFLDRVDFQYGSEIY
jgi:hypothetical protein